MGDSVQKKSEWKNYQVKEAFIDPKTWFCFFLTLVNCIGGDLADFKTMIYQSLSLNKTPLHSVVMTFPGSAVQIVSLVTCGLIATKVKSSTLIVMSIFTIPSILGTALIHFLPESKSWGRCAGLWISYTNTCSLALNFSVIASNVRGYTKKSVVSALNFIAYCVGSIAAPQFFYSRERAAGFPTGIKTMFVCYIIVFFLPLLHLAFLIRCNRKRIKEKHSMDDDKVDDYLNEDKTDWEIKGFQYSY